MHIFISAGEPSGDLHGANLVRAIQARHPDARIAGFGGPKMQAAGASLLFQLTQLAVMWFGRAIANIFTFLRLAKNAKGYFEKERPDAVVLIDFPGFHFALAKRAHAAGIPVYFFVPPQLWAWAGWRVKKVHRWFAGVLTALPFEDEWYRVRGVNTHYVGHPYFDELIGQQLDTEFVDAQRAKPGPVVSILPGSRNQEVTANFPLMLAAARIISAARPDVRFLVASFSPQQLEVARGLAAESGLPIEFHVGRTPEIIESADACISVSGSVGLEMMFRLKPAVVVYKISRLARWVSRRFIVCPFISLVNMLAGEEIYPEYLTFGNPGDEIAGDILKWLSDPACRAETVANLQKMKDRVAIPGACDRAADFLVEALSSPRQLPNPDASRPAA